MSFNNKDVNNVYYSANANKLLRSCTYECAANLVMEEAVCYSKVSVPCYAVKLG